MDIKGILKRSWQILRDYRPLWVVGFILTLLPITSLQKKWQQYFYSYLSKITNILLPEDMEKISVETQNFMEKFFTPENFSTIFTGMLVFMLAIIIWYVFSYIMKYMIEVSVIKTVNGYDEVKEKSNFLKILKLGWSKKAFHLFLIDLLVQLPAAILFCIVLTFATVFSVNDYIKYLGQEIPPDITTPYFIYISYALFALVFAGLKVLCLIGYRASVVDGFGVTDSIRQGFRMATRHFKDTLYIALSVLAVNICFIVFLSLVWLISFYISKIFGHDVNEYFDLWTKILSGQIDLKSLILPRLSSILINMLFFTIPLKIIEGLVLCFSSAVWTLSYDEFKKLDAEALPVEADTV